MFDMINLVFFYFMIPKVYNIRSTYFFEKKFTSRVVFFYLPAAQVQSPESHANANNTQGKIPCYILQGKITIIHDLKKAT
jgi:hypothetical protein